MSQYTTRQILGLIEATVGPRELGSLGRDLTGTDVSRELIHAALTKLSEEDPHARPKWLARRA